MMQSASTRSLSIISPSKSKMTARRSELTTTVSLLPSREAHPFLRCWGWRNVGPESTRGVRRSVGQDALPHRCDDLAAAARHHLKACASNAVLPPPGTTRGRGWIGWAEAQQCVCGDLSGRDLERVIDR